MYRYYCPHQMPKFAFNMYRNHTIMGLRPRPQTGSLQRTFRPLGWLGGHSRHAKGEWRVSRPKVLLKWRHCATLSKQQHTWRMWRLVRFKLLARIQD